MSSYRLLTQIVQDEISYMYNQLDYITNVIYRDNRIPKEVIGNLLSQLYERIADNIDEVTSD